MKSRRTPRTGITYRRDGRVVLRTWGVGIGRAELLLGRVSRAAWGWHFATLRVAATGHPFTVREPDPFDFEVNAEAYPTRHAAAMQLIKLYRDGAAKEVADDNA